MFLRSLTISAALLAISASSFAQSYQAGDMHISNPYARPTVPGQTSGGAYITMENKGTTPDKLVSVASSAAKSVEIHTMSMDGNVMKMREVPNIEIKPATTVTMKPGGGYHIMLIGINQQLKAGDTITLTLRFEKSGNVDISAVVENRGEKNPMGKMGHPHK